MRSRLTLASLFLILLALPLASCADANEPSAQPASAAPKSEEGGPPGPGWCWNEETQGWGRC